MNENGLAGAASGGYGLAKPVLAKRRAPRRRAGTPIHPSNTRKEIR